MSFDSSPVDRWRKVELREGESITGTVVRLPQHGAFHGTSVFLELDDGEVVALPASASKGHTVLERLRGDVRVGDRVAITYHGRRTTVGDYSSKDWRSNGGTGRGRAAREFSAKTPIDLGQLPT